MNRLIILIICACVFSACSNPDAAPGGDTVTLNLNGGYFVNGNTSTIYGGIYSPIPLKKVLSDIIYPPVIKDGRVFAVWNTKPDGSGEDYINDSIVTKSITLYAIYSNVLRTREDFESIVCGDPDKIYTLEADISLAYGDPWQPLCANPAKPFKGRIYGKGNGLSYFSTRASVAERPQYSGLFAYIENAKIVDLKMLNVRVYGGYAAGAVAGSASNSVIERIEVTGEIRGSGFVGGLAGEILNGSTITKSKFGVISGVEEKLITATGNNSSAGGITGLMQDSIITQSVSDAFITLPDNSSYAGGIAGRAENSTASDVLHEGRLTASGTGCSAGGIIGYSTGSYIEHAYSDSSITATGSGSYAGGIAGVTTGGGITGSAALNIAINGDTALRISGSVSGTEINNTYARANQVVNIGSATDGTSRRISDMRKKPLFFQDTLGMKFREVWYMPDYYEYPRLIWEQLPQYNTIRTASELKTMSRNPDRWYVLIKDIDLYELDSDGKVVTWSPVGPNYDSIFTGRLDGNGHTIRNITPKAITAGDVNGHMGFFGIIENGVVTDLNVHFNLPETSPAIDGDSIYSGGLAGRLINTRVENVNVTGTVSVGLYTGGIAARAENNSTVISSSFNGSIKNLDNTSVTGVSGGLTGIILNSTIYYSHTAGNINTHVLNHTQTAGGIAGSITQSSTVFSNYSNMDVYAAGGAMPCAGGIAGTIINSLIANAYSTGSVEASSNDHIAPAIDLRPYAGGITGYADNSTIQSTAALGISVAATADNVTAKSILTTADRISGTVNASASNNHAAASMAVIADNTAGIHGTDIISTDIGFFENILGWNFSDVWEMPYGASYPVFQGGNE